jgi:RNA polymerase sigma factor (sigma-70 family)
MQQYERGQSIMTDPQQDGQSAAYFANLSVSDLARECADATKKFRKGEAQNERAGLELFYRAVALRDDYAWTCLYRQYAPLVLTWVNQHQSAARVFGQDGPEPLVNAAFARFAQAMTPTKMEGAQLAALLKYLKMCAHSAVADVVRAQHARQYEEALSIEEHDPPIGDPAEGVVAALAAQELWQAILAELDGEQERVVIYCAFVLGLKPTEIAALHRRLFPSVEEVYRTRRNALERLRRNQRLHWQVTRLTGRGQEQ